MATEVQIRQGNQIGGCVTMITYTGDGGTVRIMIDYGMSLPGAEKKEDYQHDWEREPVDAVLFTHYHGDHAGRFLENPTQTRLYLGGASRQVMINIYQALTRARDQRTASSARKALAVLKDDARIVEVKRDTPMDIGPVTVTGAVFFGRSIFSQPSDHFPGHFIHIVLIFRFRLKIIIRVVAETDRSIPPEDVIAFLEEMTDIFIIMTGQDIHGAHNMHVIEFRLLIIIFRFSLRGRF